MGWLRQTIAVLALNFRTIPGRLSSSAVAIVGIGAYRVGFDRPKATLGLQPDKLAGAHVWVLPNTSGLNANHSPADFGRAFGELRRFGQGERDDASRPEARTGGPRR